MVLKRWLYLVHRWLGVALAVVMAAWFLSGMVMLYVGYPKLTPAERLRGLPVLAAEGCCVPLQQALQAAGLVQARAASESWRLTSVAGEPRYVFADGPKRVVAVDARSGRPVATLSDAEALAAARHFAGGAPGEHRGRVQEDAWTHSRALDAHRPLHVVAVDDEAGRWLYVSSRTGEVVRDATRTERSWGWLGAWLHWLYMFRGGAVDAWWADIVIWLSVAATVGAVAGLVIGVMRWRFRGTYRSGRRTPYAGFMDRWHHVFGLLGGILCITWIFSGLMSMNPWKVFDAPGRKPDRAAYAGGPLDAATAPPADGVLQQLQAAGMAPRELVWRRIGGVPDVVAVGAAGRSRVDAQGLQPGDLPAERWSRAAEALLPGARVVARERLTAYDRWYYSREPHTMTGHNERPLPAWRLKFDDPNDTWVVIDERSGAIVQISDHHRRVDRWLFAFLHSFDLPQLLAARPAWDAWMLAFSVAGLVLSVTGVVTGWRRLRRKAHEWQVRRLRAGA